MNNWYQIKGEILKKLAAHFQEATESDELSFHSLSIEIPKISFVDFASTLKDKILCYFKNKDASLEYLGVGMVALFQHKDDLDSIQSLLEENPKLTFLGGQSFFNDEKISFEWEDYGSRFIFLPKVLAKKSINDGVEKYTLTFYYPEDVIGSIDAQTNYIFQIEDILSFKPYLVEDNYQFNQSYQEPVLEEWNESIDKCTQSFKDDPEFHKVVLAKKDTFLSNSPINALKIFREMHQFAEESYCFFLQVEPSKAFLSISPEKLFQLNDQKIEVDCIAGTRARGNNAEEEELLSRELLTSNKELNEHNIVAEEICNRLNYLCDEVEKPEKLNLLKLKHVQHLFGEFYGKVNKNFSLEEIIKVMHPTPAVGGRPWHRAKDYIKNLEPFQRGFYAAPVGVISSDHTEFAVGIRSCLVNGESLHIYAGAGIVPGSIGIEEWKEVQNKMKNFLQIL